ncbi:TIGR03915 family putative DNA repair protein [Clostridium sp. AL.422]|uniref:TIGR03915 family putative DNA repair protein n=1 Tax=Clostridium TaxID=1485 RepID=UPI00293DDC7E|nr:MULTISPECIES: TIGR03915 family putative DNA repair protein [unclassified Clostridium]MDV4149451.1 TIGR03915 family putative DNA repair protein [Clostridium sp. AL.422]
MLKLIYEDSFEGFLTAIYYAFYSKDEIISIEADNSSDIDMLTTIEYLKTDVEKYKKVKDSIVTKIDPLALNKIYKLYLSNHKKKGILCYKYLKTAFKLGSNVHKHLYLDIVRELDLIEKRVSMEAHRFVGFVRFSLINDKFLYSSIEPDNNILELISNHFANRFSNEYWIIHDTKRNIASVYNKIAWEITEMNSEIYNSLKNYNDEFEDLWKNYFISTAIKERTNPKLQKQFMPKRYWKHLTEIEDK